MGPLGGIAHPRATVPAMVGPLAGPQSYAAAPGREDKGIQGKANTYNSATKHNLSTVIIVPGGLAALLSEP
jgi:hypothetical protein